MADSTAEIGGSYDLRGELLQELRRSFQTPIRPGNVTQGYVISMAMLAVALALIFALFFALLAFMAWLVIWHVWAAAASLSQGPYFIFHLPMAALGGVLLAFLLKPLFLGRKIRGGTAIALAPQDEPELFELVRDLCAAVDAPVPEVIEVDCEPNAGASFRAGLDGLMRRKMVLRIGLPLVGSMTVRDFAGVLAHEMGHFNQRHGMVWSYLIRRLNFFFAQIVFERDRLDEWLARRSRSREAGSQLLYFAAAGMIEPARGVLWMFLVIGEALTCQAQRQMEFDADEFEAKVAGPDRFPATSRLLGSLQIGAIKARSDLPSAFDSGRLPDDFPLMVMTRARDTTPKEAKLLESNANRKTGWFDTHPNDQDRSTNVQRILGHGIVECGQPARDLFRQFPDLCRRASVTFYKSVVGEGLSKIKLVDTATLAREHVEMSQGITRVRRYFQDQIAPLRLVFPSQSALDTPREPLDVGQLKREVWDARDQMLALSKSLGSSFIDYQRASADLTISSAGLAIGSMLAGMDPQGQITARARRDSEAASRRLKHASSRIDLFEAAAQRRMTLALQLLASDEMAGRLGPDVAARREKVRRMMELADKLADCQAQIRKVGELNLFAQVLYANLKTRRRFLPLESQVFKSLESIVMELTTMTRLLDGRRYPFAHSVAGITIADVLVPQMPDKRDIGQVLRAATVGFDRFAELSALVLAQIVEEAQAVETAIGLEPLDEFDRAQNIELQKAERRKAVGRHYLSYGSRAMAGTAMLAGLIWMSILPPSLPIMPWDDGRPGDFAFRPAAFGLPGSSGQVSLAYQPSAPVGQPNWFQPGNPGYFQPGQPGHQASMPTYWDPGYSQYYSPNLNPAGPQAINSGMMPGQQMVGGRPVQSGAVVYQPPQNFSPPPPRPGFFSGGGGSPQPGQSGQPGGGGWGFGMGGPQPGGAPQGRGGGPGPGGGGGGGHR